MEKLTSQIQQDCAQKSPCFYRKDSRCTFWEEAEKIPAAWKKVFPEDVDSDLTAIDIFREP